MTCGAVPSVNPPIDAADYQNRVRVSEHKDQTSMTGNNQQAADGFTDVPQQFPETIKNPVEWRSYATNHLEEHLNRASTDERIGSNGIYEGQHNV